MTERAPKETSAAEYENKLSVKLTDISRQSFRRDTKQALPFVVPDGYSIYIGSGSHDSIRRANGLGSLSLTEGVIEINNAKVRVIFKSRYDPPQMDGSITDKNNMAEAIVDKITKEISKLLT